MEETPSIIRYCYKFDGMDYKYQLLNSMTSIKLKDMSDDLIKNELILRMCTFYPLNNTFVWLLNDVLEQRRFIKIKHLKDIIQSNKM